MAHSFANLHVINHPLIQHKLTLMRMEETSLAISGAAAGNCFADGI